MSTISVGLLIAVAVLILVAVAVGTISARLFIAASRSHRDAKGPDEEI